MNITLKKEALDRLLSDIGRDLKEVHAEIAKLEVKKDLLESQYNLWRKELLAIEKNA